MQNDQMPLSNAASESTIVLFVRVPQSKANARQTKPIVPA